MLVSFAVSTSGLYLANFNPKLAAPTHSEAQNIIRSLIEMSTVVQIPGFANFQDFTTAYANEITAAWNVWSVAVAPTLLSRVGDKGIESRSDFKNRMDVLYGQWNERHEIIFFRYSSPRNAALLEKIFGSHSNLVLEMRPIQRKADITNPLAATQLDGYEALILDSNGSDPKTIRCLFSEGRCDNGAVPYVGYDADLISMEKSIRAYCR